MKPKIHPEYTTITVTCSCGHSWDTRSTLGRDLHVEVCSQCHPFYTGKQKIVDTAGRVERFRQKYARKTSTKSTSASLFAQRAATSARRAPFVSAPEGAPHGRRGPGCRSLIANA